MRRTHARLPQAGGNFTKIYFLYQDVQLRLNSLPSSRGAAGTRLCLATTPDAPELVLEQLVGVRNSVNQCLDIVDVSAWTGDPLNSNFIYSQLHLLRETITEARQMLKGEEDNAKEKWLETSADENVGYLYLALPVEFRLQFETGTGKKRETDLLGIDVRPSITAASFISSLYCRLGSSAVSENTRVYRTYTRTNRFCF